MYVYSPDVPVNRFSGLYWGECSAIYCSCSQSHSTNFSFHLVPMLGGQRRCGLSKAFTHMKYSLSVQNCGLKHKLFHFICNTISSHWGYCCLVHVILKFPWCCESMFILEIAFVISNTAHSKLHSFIFLHNPFRSLTFSSLPLPLPLLSLLSAANVLSLSLSLSPSLSIHILYLSLSVLTFAGHCISLLRLSPASD